MEVGLSSDDSCDSEMKLMKHQLTEFGLNEEYLSKEEMFDLLKALKNSKSTAKEDDFRRKTVEVKMDCTSPRKPMKRRYLNVRDRRLPWSLLPSTITPSEKARTLAVYIKMMSINSYRQARQSENFAAWPPPLQIVEESTRIQPFRSTRSGRLVPVYSGFDDDPSDLDFVVTKTKKRRICNSENDGVHTNKVVSLKRKTSKEENIRPVKEVKMNFENNNIEIKNMSTNVKPKKDLFTLIED